MLAVLSLSLVGSWLGGSTWRAPLASPVARRVSHVPHCLESDIESLEVQADAAGYEGDSFVTVGLTAPGVAQNLAAANVSAPNALQRSSFAPIASGRDVIIHACTGSGKTLAFLLPLLQALDPTSREPQALVLCPSRELAFQTLRVASMLLQGTSLRVCGAAGGANPARQIEKIRKEKPQLLVGTAGRVRELAFEWRKLKLQRVRHLVIDEVDDALRGANLKPTVELIDSFRDGRPLQLIFASATADTPTVRRSAVQLLDRPLLLRLVQPGAPPSPNGVAELPLTLRHGVYVLPAQKHLEAIRQLAHSSPTPTCLVFVNSPHRAKMVCEKLAEGYGVTAAPLYGQQEREEKVDVMRRRDPGSAYPARAPQRMILTSRHHDAKCPACHILYCRLLDGRLRFVVTTEMGARGLDIPGLSHVVNLELPTDTGHYVHRAGRTGRAGADGTVISVVSPEKTFVVEKLTKRLGLTLEHVTFRAGQLERAKSPRKRKPPPAATQEQGGGTEVAGRGGAGRGRAGRGGAGRGGARRGRHAPPRPALAVRPPATAQARR